MEAEPDESTTRDALFVASLSGDRAAFGAVYDRYGDRVHDFCWSMLRDRGEAAVVVRDTFVIAARRLAQLQHPSHLRPWLYAIARRRVLRRLCARRRPPGGAGVARMPGVGAGRQGPMDKRSLRNLVWNVAAGLPHRDRALLDLHLRQGLEGAELAEAMGVSSQQAAARLADLHAEVEWSMGSLLVARLGWRECDGLAALLRDWDGRLTAGVRKRISAHVQRCEGCDERHLAIVSPCALLSAVPMVAAPSRVRPQVMSRARLPSGRHATGLVPGLNTVHRMLVATLLMVLGVSGFWVGRQLMPSPEPVVSGTLALPPITVETPQPRDTEPAPPPEDQEQAAPAADSSPISAEGGSQAPAPVPAALTLSSTDVDLGADQERATITVGNSGEAPLDWDASASVAWLSLEPAGGRVDGGGSIQLSVAADRAGLPEGPAQAIIALSTNAGAVEVRVRLVVERPPEVASKGASPSPLVVKGCEPATASVSAVVDDESGVESVALRWTGPDGATGDTAMTADGRTWTGALGPFAEPGTVTWSIAATDTRGNTAETGSSQLPVEPCDEEEEPDPGASPSGRPSPPASESATPEKTPSPRPSM